MLFVVEEVVSLLLIDQKLFDALRTGKASSMSYTFAQDYAK